MERKEVLAFEFQIDQIANDSPPLKDQGEWEECYKEGVRVYGPASVYHLIDEPGSQGVPIGKSGVAPAIYALVRAGYATIDKFTRTPIIGVIADTKRFGRTPELDTLDKIDLLQEKALELVKRNPILLSRN